MNTLLIQWAGLGSILHLHAYLVTQDAELLPTNYSGTYLSLLAYMIGMIHEYYSCVTEGLNHGCLKTKKSSDSELVCF